MARNRRKCHLEDRIGLSQSSHRNAQQGTHRIGIEKRPRVQDLDCAWIVAHPSVTPPAISPREFDFGDSQPGFLNPGRGSNSKGADLNPRPCLSRSLFPVPCYCVTATGGFAGAFRCLAFGDSGFSGYLRLLRPLRPFRRFRLLCESRPLGDAHVSHLVCSPRSWPRRRRSRPVTVLLSSPVMSSG